MLGSFAAVQAGSRERDVSGNNFETKLRELHEGKIDFQAFVVATRPVFRAMAMSLARRWRPPEWYTLEDVEQELYLGAWRAVFGREGKGGRWVEYDPERASLVRYVMFNAMYEAKRKLHVARGVSIHGNPDKKKSVIEQPASRMGDDGEGFLEALLAEPALALEEMVRAQETRRAATSALAHCKTQNERFAVLAIREAGSLDDAAAVLYEDVDFRTTLRLGCEEAANGFVRRNAGAVAARITRRAVVDLPDSLFEVDDGTPG